ncbi:unnamed protein product [Clavelina lepadiformis]|uniref:UBX domain-containing protein 11 n=1 Tax=Clavelina lepadiformis TaxID=159417 RepID=A0ABP0FXL4_CLALP
MSSPLSSLDRSKKAYSNPSRKFGKRSMPLRSSEYMKEQELLDEFSRHNERQSHNEFSKDSLPQLVPLSTNSSMDFASVTSADSPLEGLTPRSILGPINTRPSQMFNPLVKPVKGNASRATPPNDLELISTMMKRITQLEKQTSYYSREVLEKDRRIKVLEEKLTLLNKNKEIFQNDSPSRVSELEAKCGLLQHQLHEMETFLADYGMIWVGDKSEFTDKYIDGNKEDSPVAMFANSSHPEFITLDKSYAVDFDLIVKNIQDLNIIAGEGKSIIQKTKDGARLKVQDTIPLTLYANGFVMFSGPFRPYSDITTRRCLSDIMDGFFPSELHKKYPDGVPIKVTDNRNVIFKDPRSKEMFPGIGRALQGEKTENLPEFITSSTTASKQTNTNCSSTEGTSCTVTSKLPAQKISVDQFLERLPKSVVRGGKVIDVRSSLKDALTIDLEKGSDSPVLVETDVVQEMQNRMNMPESIRPISARDVTTIRVKCENGKNTYILKMKFLDTIGDLRKYINQQRPRHRAPYEIITTFPKRVHSDVKKTLQESGLVPNATLHLKSRK